MLAELVEHATDRWFIRPYSITIIKRDEKKRNSEEWIDFQKGKDKHKQAKFKKDWMRESHASGMDEFTRHAHTKQQAKVLRNFNIGNELTCKYGLFNSAGPLSARPPVSWKINISRGRSPSSRRTWYVSSIVGSYFWNKRKLWSVQNYSRTMDQAKIALLKMFTYKTSTNAVARTGPHQWCAHLWYRWLAA